MNENKIIEMLLDHKDRLGRIEQNMVTKQDLGLISNTLDRLVGLADKKDQELTISSHDIRKLEDRIDKAENNIKQMKPAMGLT